MRPHMSLSVVSGVVIMCGNNLYIVRISPPLTEFGPCYRLQPIHALSKRGIMMHPEDPSTVVLKLVPFINISLVVV
jgi:hypothetical protein